MNRKQGLAQRRQELIERSSAQRTALLAAVEPLDEPFQRSRGTRIRRRK